MKTWQGSKALNIVEKALLSCKNSPTGAIAWLSSDFCGAVTFWGIGTECKPIDCHDKL